MLTAFPSGARTNSQPMAVEMKARWHRQGGSADSSSHFRAGNPKISIFWGRGGVSITLGPAAAALGNVPGPGRVPRGQKGLEEAGRPEQGLARGAGGLGQGALSPVG